MIDLSESWEIASAAGSLVPGPDVAALQWRPARVPGTAAGAIGNDGRDFDVEDWWFRCRFSVPEDWDAAPLRLELDGVATVSETFLDGQLVLAGKSMWEHQQTNIGPLRAGEHELLIVCRALAPLLRARRRPSARWRTRVVNNGNLRWYRTMIFGRSPGFAPGPAPVGPWRSVRLRRSDRAAVTQLAVRPRLEGSEGVVALTAWLDGAWTMATARLGDDAPVALTASTGNELTAELRTAAPARWWPHTHGQPTLHELVIELDGRPVARRWVGFRELAWPPDARREGLALQINGTDVFARGAVWTPADLISMAPGESALRVLLERVRDAGMNLVRVVGTGAYEPPAFHDLCDELGLLVWQDLMFANVDYPVGDPEFAAVVEAEVRTVVDELAGRPSLAVMCGNSEVEQQPAMMGLDPTLGRHEIWEKRIPALLAEAGADCAYLPSTPCGGTLPFHPDGGSTHYFGVSGYMLPVTEVRRADVRFAAECLAFANVPDEVDYPVHHPRWKEGVPRDAGTGWGIGAGWDFDDVRDSYLTQLYRLDPTSLRRYDHTRYLELSRAATGEVMAMTLGEWRRQDSRCRGALILWLKDMLPGGGLGILDHRGQPKAAYHYVRRALAPTAVWMTDEAVGGVAIHVAHDHDEPMAATLRLGLYGNGEVLVEAAQESFVLPAHGQLEWTVEGLLGRFVDPAWAYRFGPPTANAIVAGLWTGDGRPVSQAFFYPAGFPTERETAARLGLDVRLADADPAQEATDDLPRAPDGATDIVITTARLVYGARLAVAGFNPEDNWFSLEPGQTRTVRLLPSSPGAVFRGGALSAVNLRDRLEIPSP